MKTNHILIAATIVTIILMNTKKAFAKPTASGLIRGCDPFGCGHFGASRGSRTHEGEDFKAVPGESVFAPISGTVTRFPFPYGSDLSFTGIEIKSDTHDSKVFYMKASVPAGTIVKAGQKIGVAQNIAGKYGSTMQNHIHVEIRDKKGNLIQLSKLT